MKRINKILAAIDFSPHSWDAVRWAADLSRHYEAPVTLIHVYQPVAYNLPEGFALLGPSALGDLLTRLSNTLEEARKTADEAGAVATDTQLLQGAPAAEIVRHANQGSYDLIVMGTHGRTGIGHAVLGSVAERVVQKASCCVLTVPLRV